jgi:methylmalonyl-CoA mutase C-terminal domain/subunit
MEAAATITTSAASTSSQRYRASSPRKRLTTEWFPDLPAALTSPAAPIVTAGYAPHVSERIRIVIAKPGLDGHDRGAKIIARALRDAGMEVVYTGLHQTPEQIVQTVVQEDADAVGLSILSGAHMTLFKRTVELLQENQADDVVLFGGGIIPDEDIPELEKVGVAKVFTPGATMDEIVDWVRANVTAE